MIKSIKILNTCGKMYCFPATRQNTPSVNMIDQQNNSPNGQNQELFLTYCVMEKLLSLSSEAKILLPDFRRWALTDVDYRGNVFPDPTNRSVDALLSLKVNCNSASSQLTLRPTRASYPKESVLFWHDRQLHMWSAWLPPAGFVQAHEL